MLTQIFRFLVPHLYSIILHSEAVLEKQLPSPSLFSRMWWELSQAQNQPNLADSVQRPLLGLGPLTQGVRWADRPGQAHS